MEPGTQLGHYTVLAAIGRGGMGEMWKARDTRLGTRALAGTVRSFQNHYRNGWHTRKVDCLAL